MSLLSSSGTYPLITTAALALTRFHDQLPFRVSAQFVVVVMSAVSVLLWVGFGSLSESIYKAIPLQDGAMREWRDRMPAVYGDVEGGVYPALERLEHAYRTVTDAHLLEIEERYGATHALLYANTVTALPVVYADDGYRLVELSSR